jgi:hypothetical protein
VQEEGVIRFDLQFTESEPVAGATIAELNAWRRVLWQLELIGQDPDRYGGFGYGNVSQRIGRANEPAGQRRFVISGSQTGKLRELDVDHYSIVNAYDPARNRVVAEGPVKPSSESLTHGVIYDLDPSIRVVLHVHSPDIWQQAAGLQMPVTDAGVEYGTPAMAGEVRRLYHAYGSIQSGIFSMGGHPDGIVSFGMSAGEAGSVLLQSLAAALAARRSSGSHTNQEKETDSYGQR